MVSDQADRQSRYHGRVDTRVITTFVALARTGSFTAAATELHLAQSTVTAHIQTLERELRLRLFDRLPSGAVLTESGRRTLEKASDLLDAEAALRTDAAATGPIEGVVTIGATESLCGHLLPDVIASLHRTHPGVDVQLTPVGTADGIEQLRSGRLSLGLMIEPSLEVPDLVVDELGKLRLAFVCEPGHPLAGTRAGWPELAEHRWFLLEEGCAYSDDVARQLRDIPGARPRITRLGSVEAARACIAAGLGLGQLPTFAVDTHRLARFEAPRVVQPALLLARHRRRSPDRALTAVITAVSAGAQSLVRVPAARPQGHDMATLAWR